MNRDFALVICVMLMFALGVFIGYGSSESEKPTGIIEAPCNEIHYSQRGMDNRLIVCTYKDLILINDNGFQGDSLRQIKINELLEEL